MLLQRNLHTMTRDPRGNHNKVERRRHVSVVERLDMWRKIALRKETI
jgi:hypothetical protein